MPPGGLAIIKSVASLAAAARPIAADAGVIWLQLKKKLRAQTNISNVPVNVDSQGEPACH
jgi:hypothetical protein